MPKYITKDSTDEETNTEEGFCNKTSSPGLKGTSMKVSASNAEGPTSVHLCSKRTIEKHPIRMSQVQSSETLPYCT